MPYSPRYEEIFEGAVLDNAIVITATNFKPALDYFYPTDALADFAERTLGNFIRLEFPAIAFAPRRVTETEGDQFVETSVQFDADFAVTDVDAPGAMRKAIKYARAFKSIMKNASRSEWMTGLTNPNVAGVQVELAHEYSDPTVNPNVSNEWMVAVSFEVAVKFLER
jgi:hypothetical protein